MNLFDSVKAGVVGYLSFPLTNYFYNRKNIITNYKQFIKSEWYQEDLIRDLQLKKLRGLVAYCNEYIPYYRKKFRDIAISPQDIKTLDDIRLIPPLSREDVITQHHEMVDVRNQSSIPFAEGAKRGSGEPIPLAILKKHRLVRNTSSGSTGAPTVFYEDGSRSAMNWAYEMRLKQWYDIGPGAKEARMARLSTVYLPDSRSLAIRRNLWHQLILPGTNLSEADFELCLRKIREFRPRVLWGYTSALTGLADYIRRFGGVESVPFELVITWAAPMYEHEGQLLRSVFQCPVTNVYGAREVGHIAALCPHGSLHINQETLLVESEDLGAGDAIPGEILVTTLDVSPMPFIRYRMGDLGKVAKSGCSCGRSLAVLTDFLGRTGEVFTTKNGRMISPNFWCRVFMSAQHADQIKRFQIVYTKEKNLKVSIERGKGYSIDAENYVRKMIADNFSSDTEVQFIYVNGIEARISGKYQMVINEAKQ